MHPAEQAPPFTATGPAVAVPIFPYPTTDAERHATAWGIYAWVVAHPELHDQSDWMAFRRKDVAVTAQDAVSCGTAGCYAGWAAWLTGAAIQRTTMQCRCSSDCGYTQVSVRAVPPGGLPVLVSDYVTEMLRLGDVVYSGFPFDNLYHPANDLNDIAHALTIVVGPPPAVRAVQDDDGAVWWREGDGAGTWRCTVGDRRLSWHELIQDGIPADVTEQVGA